MSEILLAMTSVQNSIPVISVYLQAEWKTVWIQISWLLWPYKKIPVFRVARPYLVKHQFFFRFSGKNIILCILKGKCLSKCIKLYFFFFKKKKYLCLPYLNFSDLLPETRAATIQSPHDTIRITIFASRYNTYRDTFLTTLEP